jgi:RNA-directed DNA polymerase
MSRMYLNVQTDSWGKIPWPKVESFVFRFQTRIYKASLEKNYGKMRALQTRLAQSVHARLLAVRRVTMDSCDNNLITTGPLRMELVRTLKFDGKAQPIRRTWIPKPGRLAAPGGCPLGSGSRSRSRSREVVADRAKQALAQMVLEPEWEARFEPNSYGFRPGRSCQDAMEALASLAIIQRAKYVLDAIIYRDIAKCFDRINTSSLLEKLDTYPVMRNQIKAWLEADILTGFANRPKSIEPSDSGEGGLISPLLANIALHGMENALNEWAQQQARREKIHNLSFARRVILVRYADDFLLLHKARREEIHNLSFARRVVQGAQGFLSQWLQPMGLELHPDQTRIVTTGEGFHFLAHDLLHLGKGSHGLVRVAPSKKSQETLLSQTREVIQSHKGSAVHRLISALVPLILGWGKYFQFSECSAIFHRMDWSIFQQLRAWVFRRHPTWGRQRIKHKYFPENKTWRFHGKKYRDNWVLYDSYMSKGVRKEFHLIRLSWISSSKHVKVRGTKSPFDGDLIYWSLRLQNHRTRAAFGLKFRI